MDLLRQPSHAKTRPNRFLSFRLLACTILIIGGGFLTAAAYILTQQRVNQHTQLKFNEVTETHVRQLSHHLEKYGDILYATRGLFATTTVDATAWDHFIRAQNATDRYPGMKALAYAEIVKTDDLPEHLERLRTENHGQLIEIHPKRNAGEHIILTYHEEAATGRPQALKALGFDLASNPERYTAIKQAHATNKIVATSPIDLVTNTEKGFILLLPLSANRDTVQEPTTIFGYTIAAFEATTLIDKTIGQRLDQYRTSMSITDVTDGHSIPLYDRSYKTSGQVISRNVVIKVANRDWQITFQSPTSSLLMVTDRWAPTVVVAIGIGSIMLSCLVVYTLRLRRALRYTITS